MFRARASAFVLLVCFVGQHLACAGSDRAPLSSERTDAGPTTTTDPTEPPPETKPTNPKKPDEALPPEVDAIAPAKATVNAIGPSVVVSGKNFVSRSIIQLDGAPLATSFVSDTELRATIPSASLTAVKTLRVSVGTAPPGGGASKEVIFAVENPAPLVTSLNPLSAVAGAGATNLEVAGTEFVAGAKIVFGTTDLVTTFVSEKSLKATLPASMLTDSGSIPVTVENPAPGGGPSTAIAFTIANPSASIQGLNPGSALVGAGGVILAVSGSGFINGSSILFNGAELATTYDSSSSLHASLPASFFTTAGDFPIAVQNPPPGGGVSTPAVFHVQYPSPKVTSIAPTFASAGASPTEITVIGTGFVPSSQITFDNAAAATTLVDATHLKATLTAAQLANAATIAVRVITPTPGGGTSTAASFEVRNGVPTILSLNPGAVPAGSANTNVVLTGTGFLSTSAVKSNGTIIPSTFVSATQLNAVVPANHLLFPGSVALTVSNPAPGGGTSTAMNMSVGCDTSNVDVSLGAIGTVTELATNFATAASMPRWTDAGSCTSVTLSTTGQPGRYWIVQNTAGVPITLSAWADCRADGLQDDAYLTFYRRPTLPANDVERLGCAMAVSEGLNGPGGYSSPELGQSPWCPGLTKDNGGGLTLGVCEKAVVHIQPYSMTSTTYPPPPIVRVKAE